MADPLLQLFANHARRATEFADRIYEPVVGVVVDNKDPDKLSRVKVSFPHLPGTDNSAWAPLAALGAGKERGWYFLPEIDDEVVVMFAHGDIGRPVVLGAVWNGKDAPPDTNDGANERRSIVSREGNRIVFDDDGGTVTLEDAGGIGKITIDAENKITIEATSGDVCIQAPDGELNIVAKELKATGTMNLHVTAGSTGAAIGGDGKVTLKGGSVIKVAGMETSLASGSAQAPAEAQDACEPLDDPVGGGGGGAGSSSGGGGGDSAGGDTGGSESSSTAADQSPESESEPPPPATPPGTSPNMAPDEPAPVVVSAKWGEDSIEFGDTVEMLATCANAAGKAATFTVKDADDPDGDAIGTASGTCGDDSVTATWTAPAGPEPQEVTFEVAVEDQTAKAGVLSFLVTAEGSLRWNNEPADDIPLVITTRDGKEHKVKTDTAGTWKLEKVPAGDYKVKFELAPLPSDDDPAAGDDAAADGGGHGDPAADLE